MHQHAARHEPNANTLRSAPTTTRPAPAAGDVNCDGTLPIGSDAIVRPEAGSTTVDHQTRMMGEVAKLVVPQGMGKDQIGVMDAGRFKTTADIALKFHVINAPADPAKSYTNNFVGH